jgi:hypothetical protein
MHAGLHAGSALKQGNRYFGSALNLTSRVAALRGTVKYFALKISLPGHEKSSGLRLCRWDGFNSRTLLTLLLYLKSFQEHNDEKTLSLILSAASR